MLKNMCSAIAKLNSPIG